MELIVLKKFPFLFVLANRWKQWIFYLVSSVCLKLPTPPPGGPAGRAGRQGGKVDRGVGPGVAE